MKDYATRHRREWLDQVVRSVDRDYPNDYQGVQERLQHAINRMGAGYLLHPSHAPVRGAHNRLGQRIESNHGGR